LKSPSHLFQNKFKARCCMKILALCPRNPFHYRNICFIALCYVIPSNGKKNVVYTLR
jgi:hypothetical protein